MSTQGLQGPFSEARFCIIRVFCRDLDIHMLIYFHEIPAATSKPKQLHGQGFEPFDTLSPKLSLRAECPKFLGILTPTVRLIPNILTCSFGR